MSSLQDDETLHPKSQDSEIHSLSLWWRGIHAVMKEYLMVIIMTREESEESGVFSFCQRLILSSQSDMKTLSLIPLLLLNSPPRLSDFPLRLSSLREERIFFFKEDGSSWRRKTVTENGRENQWKTREKMRRGNYSLEEDVMRMFHGKQSLLWTRFPNQKVPWKSCQSSWSLLCCHWRVRDPLHLSGRRQQQEHHSDHRTDFNCFFSETSEIVRPFLPKSAGC